MATLRPAVLSVLVMVVVVFPHGGKLVNGGLKNKEGALMNLIAAVEKAAS